MELPSGDSSILPFHPGLQSRQCTTISGHPPSQLLIVFNPNNPTSPITRPHSTLLLPHYCVSSSLLSLVIYSLACCVQLWPQFVSIFVLVFFFSFFCQHPVTSLFHDLRFCVLYCTLSQHEIYFEKKMPLTIKELIGSVQ